MFALFTSKLSIIFLIKSVTLQDLEPCPYEEQEYGKYDGVEYTNITENGGSVNIVIWNDAEDGSGFKYCNGVIINKTHILTSAHCLINIDFVRDSKTHQFSCVEAKPSRYEVLTGTTYLVSNEETQIRYGKKIHIHPKFRPIGNLSFDVGYLELDKPLNLTEKTVRPHRTNNIIVRSYHNLIRKEKTFHVFTYGNSECSAVYTKRVRDRGYKFMAGGNFQRLYKIAIVKTSKKACDELFKLYEDLGIYLDRQHIICGKTNFTNPECEDFSGSMLNLNPGVISGIGLPPITCTPPGNVMFFLRTSALSKFVLGLTPEVATPKPKPKSK